MALLPLQFFTSFVFAAIFNNFSPPSHYTFCACIDQVNLFKLKIIDKVNWWQLLSHPGIVLRACPPSQKVYKSQGVKCEAQNDKYIKRLVLEVKTSNKAKRGQSFENVVPGMCAMHRGFFGRFRCKRDHPDFGRCYTCIRAALGIQTINIHKYIQTIYTIYTTNIYNRYIHNIYTKYIQIITTNSYKW